MYTITKVQYFIFTPCENHLWEKKFEYQSNGSTNQDEQGGVNDTLKQTRLDIIIYQLMNINISSN